MTPADELKLRRLAELRKMTDEVNRGAVDDVAWAGYLRRLAKLTEEKQP